MTEGKPNKTPWGTRGVFFSRFFKTVLVFAGLVLIPSCDGQSNKSRIDVFGAYHLINHVCDTRETISFVIQEFEINLPCQARELFSASEVESHPVDYANTEYKSGLSPIPILALHFQLKDPKIYNWEVPRPAGTILSLYISPHSKISQNCKHYTETQIWCSHALFVNETDLTIRLTFNAGKTHALTPIKISPEKRPWAYYPEDKWPELYEQTQQFVDSILE